jgi:hypothetical protein
VCLEEDQQTAAIVEEYDGNSDSDNDEIGAPAMGVKMDLSLLSGGIKGRIGMNTYGNNGTITTQALNGRSSKALPAPTATTHD